MKITNLNPECLATALLLALLGLVCAFPSLTGERSESTALESGDQGVPFLPPSLSAGDLRRLIRDRQERREETHEELARIELPAECGTATP